VIEKEDKKILIGCGKLRRKIIECGIVHQR
jgi:hypothetical protein